MGNGVALIWQFVVEIDPPYKLARVELKMSLNVVQLVVLQFVISDTTIS